jgi:hypothetical protein
METVIYAGEAHAQMMKDSGVSTVKVQPLQLPKPSR